MHNWDIFVTKRLAKMFSHTPLILMYLNYVGSKDFIFSLGVPCSWGCFDKQYTLEI